MDRPDEARRVAAQGRRRRDRAGAQALPPRQRRLSRRPTRASARWCRRPTTQSGARQLEAGRLPRAPAEGSVGQRLPVPEPRRDAARSTSSASGPIARAAAKAVRRGYRQLGLQGFTLIEVLVVVAITGIVLALAAVNLFPSDAQVARRESGTGRARDRARARRGVVRRPPHRGHLRRRAAARVAPRAATPGNPIPRATARSERAFASPRSTSTARRSSPATASSSFPTGSASRFAWRWKCAGCRGRSKAMRRPCDCCDDDWAPPAGRRTRESNGGSPSSRSWSRSRSSRWRSPRRRARRVSRPTARSRRASACSPPGRRRIAWPRSARAASSRRRHHALHHRRRAASRS